MKMMRDVNTLKSLFVKMDIVEAKIAEDLERDKHKEESKIIDQIKTDSSHFYCYARRFSKKEDSIGPLEKEDGSYTNINREMAEILDKALMCFIK